MVHRVKLLTWLTFHNTVPILVVTTELSVQLIANVPGKEARDGPSTWASVTHVGEQGAIPSPIISGMWRVN